MTALGERDVEFCFSGLVGYSAGLAGHYTAESESQKLADFDQSSGNLLERLVFNNRLAMVIYSRALTLSRTKRQAEALAVFGQAAEKVLARRIGAGRVKSLRDALEQDWGAPA